MFPRRAKGRHHAATHGGDTQTTTTTTTAAPALRHPHAPAAEKQRAGIQPSRGRRKRTLLGVSLALPPPPRRRTSLHHYAICTLPMADNGARQPTTVIPIARRARDPKLKTARPLMKSCAGP